MVFCELRKSFAAANGGDSSMADTFSDFIARDRERLHAEREQVFSAQLPLGCRPPMLIRAIAAHVALNVRLTMRFTPYLPAGHLDGITQNSIHRKRVIGLRLPELPCRFPVRQLRVCEEIGAKRRYELSSPARQNRFPVPPLTKPPPGGTLFRNPVRFFGRILSHLAA